MSPLLLKYNISHSSAIEDVSPESPKRSSAKQSLAHDSSNVHGAPHGYRPTANSAIREIGIAVAQDSFVPIVSPFALATPLLDDHFNDLFDLLHGITRALIDPFPLRDRTAETELVEDNMQVDDIATLLS